MKRYACCLGVLTAMGLAACAGGPTRTATATGGGGGLVASSGPAPQPADPSHEHTIDADDVASAISGHGDLRGIPTPQPARGEPRSEPRADAPTPQGGDPFRGYGNNPAAFMVRTGRSY